MIFVQLIAAGVALAAAPTAAEPREAPEPAPTTAPAAKRETRYCAEFTITGSHIPRRTCHTRAEWMKQGYDPLNDK